MMGFALIPHVGNQHIDNITEAINILATSVLNFIRKKHTLAILWLLTCSGLMNKSVGLKLKPAFLYIKH